METDSTTGKEVEPGETEHEGTDIETDDAADVEAKSDEVLTNMGGGERANMSGGEEADMDYSDVTSQNLNSSIF